MRSEGNAPKNTEPTVGFSFTTMLQHTSRLWSRIFFSTERDGHVQRMAEGRLTKIALKWMPKQKRARGRRKKNWMEGIRKAMNERNLNEGQWEDRKQWSLGVGQRRTKF